MDQEACPLCSRLFPITALIGHVDVCQGIDESTGAHQVEGDADFELALRLQQEEDQTFHQQSKRQKVEGESALDSDEQFARSLQEAESNSATFKCAACNKDHELSNIYILDECTHKFCKDCIVKYVHEQIHKTVSVGCPTCKASLSVRDMNDLLPKVTGSKKSKLGPTGSDKNATERLHSELTHIMKSKPETQGYSIEPAEDSLYQWDVKFFNFDKKDPIAQDLEKTGMKHILLSVTFPRTYPFNPPFIRVIKPRFQYRTGHVTVGGSICMELLTNKGWSPANTVEAVLMSVRSQFLEGGARLDTVSRHPYTEAEAKVAFDRMVREHGWG